MTMRIHLILACLVSLCAHLAFAWGEEAVQGAYALDSDPTRACVVVTNETVWLREGAIWRPGVFSGNSEYGGSFRPLGENLGRHQWQEICRIRALWEVEAFAKMGVAVQTGDVVRVTIDHTDPNRYVRSAGQRLVRCSMPDFSDVLREKAYVGYWKPVKDYDRDGREKAPGTDLAEKLQLLITEEGDAICYSPAVQVSQDNPEPYRYDKVIPIDGGLRFDFRERYKTSHDPLNCLYRALWLDEEGRLHLFSHDDHTVFERSGKTFDNPIERRRKMAADGAYHGVWGVNHEFKILIFSLERTGRGLLSLFMGAVLFDWKAVGDEIVCTPDPESSELIGCDWKRMVLRYSPEKNELTVVSIETEAGTLDLVGKSFKLLSWQVELDEVYARVAEAKKDPRWKLRLARERARREKRKGTAAP